MNICHKTRAFMGAYLYGDMQPDEMREIRIHLETCDECRAEMQCQSDTISRIPDESPSLSAEDRAKILWSVKGAMRGQNAMRHTTPFRRAAWAFGAVAAVAVVFAAGAVVGGRSAFFPHKAPVTVSQPPPTTRPAPKPPEPAPTLTAQATPEPLVIASAIPTSGSWERARRSGDPILGWRGLRLARRPGDIGTGNAPDLFSDDTTQAVGKTPSAGVVIQPLSPSPGESISTVRGKLTLTCAECPWADHYEFAVYDSITATLVLSTSSNGPTVTLDASDLLPGRAYVWQVEAIDAAGHYVGGSPGSGAAPWTFRLERK